MESLASQRLVITGDGPQQIVLSSRDLNVLVFPSQVTSAVTSKTDLQADKDGRNVIVRARSGPADLIITAGSLTYVFEITVQPALSAQMINIDDFRGPSMDRDADPIRHAADYQDGLLEVINLMAKGSIPKGYFALTIPQEFYPKWLELKVLNAVEYRGPKYRVTVYVLENIAQTRYTIRQPEFYTGRQKAIALDRQVVEPGERVEILIADDTPPIREKAAPKIDPDSKN